MNIPLNLTFVNILQIRQHLKKMENTLWPLFKATCTVNSNFGSYAKNITLQNDLADLATYIKHPIGILYRMVSLIDKQDKSHAVG